MSHSDHSNSLTANGLRVVYALLLTIFWPFPSAFSQCSLTCNDGLQVSLDQTGQALITIPLIAPNAPSSCPGTLQLKLFTQLGAQIPNNTVNCSHIGQTITAQVKHLASGNFCTGTLEVRDALPPVVVCADKFIFCYQDASPASVGFPSMTDNCTPSNNLTVNYFDTETSLGCGTFQNGIQVLKRINRTWFVTDEYGNTTECLQKIWLKHIALSNVVFPPNLEGVINPALNCDQDPNDLSLTGQPTVEGIPIENSPDCEIGVAFSDQIINICPPAGYSVLRTWTAVDFCSGTFSNRLQIIKIEDNTPPTMTPPDDFTVGTDGFLCTGTVSLPQADVSDDCSAITVTPSWAYGTGYGPFIGVSKGTHLVTYTATDACGNSTQATVNVTVEDTSSPQAICSANLQVSLSSQGVGYVNAGTINAGSFDNCGQVALTISRDDSTYSATVQVTCADIGPPLPMTLKVTDAVGLENFCVAEVNVRDFLKPNLTCPANVTLTCLQDYTNLQLTGQAIASDNCALQSLGFTEVKSLGPCNIGSVARTWKATDVAGNTKVCTQQIVLQAVSTVNVVFPPNVTVSDCSDPSATLPPATGEPVTSGQHCSPLSVTFTDQIFTTAPPPACYRIVRAWKVIDFCIYDPNDSTKGVWQQMQIIDIVDDVPPALLLPPDLTLAADPTNCLAVATLQDASATDCSSQISISNNSLYASATGANASGTYPLGTHSIVFTVTDGCGNFGQKTLNITVQDETAPTAVCKSGVVVNLDSMGTAPLDANLLDGGSVDGCSPSANLSFTVLIKDFSCQTLGDQQVVLTVTDVAGNASPCVATVSVADPTGACQPPPPTNFIIEGTIRTETGAPVAEIPLVLSGDGFLETAQCDTDGHYIFEDVPGGNTYFLKPSNNAKWLNGVSTFDLVLITKHVLGLDTFETPYKYIAADANHSGSVTTFDNVAIRKVILGITDSVPGNTSWRFVDAAYDFTDPTAPLSENFPEEIVFITLNANQLGQDFVGVKIGDLNNSTNAADPRSPRDTLFLSLPNIELPVGKTTLPISLKNWSQLDGFQFELALDTTKTTLQKVEFARPDLFSEANLFYKPEGKLAVSWHQSVVGINPPGDSLLFILHLQGRQKTNTISTLKLEAERLIPEAYDTENELFAVVGLRFQDFLKPMSVWLNLFPIHPNPFCQEARIPFRLSAPAELALSVFNISGKPVFQKKETFPAGASEWLIRQENLLGTGLYYFQISGTDVPPVGGRFVLLCND